MPDAVVRYRTFGSALRRAIARAAQRWISRKRHTVESDDRLIEEIRAGRVPADDPDPVAALLARWRRETRRCS
jgi:hypothetical protein